MPWDPRYKKGVDIPTWDWLAFFPGGTMQPGFATAYDGSRYIYIVAQVGSATAASTTQLWRFDTWTEGWQYLAAVTSSFTGLDVEYDVVRNVLYIIHGNSATTWQIFNCNLVAVTVMNITIQPLTLATGAPALPIAAGAASSLTQPDDFATVGTLAPNGASPIDSGVATAASTTTSIVTSDATATFGPGEVGCYIRFTSGALAGQRRLITGWTSKSTVTTLAFASAPAAGSTFVVEVPEGTATSGTTTTLTMTGAGWTVNQYRDADVIIVGGTGNGQRRRIASNTADTLTLAAAYTAPAANPRVGPFGIAPAADSVFRIVPSSDFLYYQNGGGTGLYRIDTAQTGAAPAWSGVLAAVPGAVGGGGNTIYAGQYDPFSIIAVRGGATSTIYRFHIGTLTWTTLTSIAGVETITTGASVCGVHGRRRLFIQKEGATRTYFYDVTTGGWEPGPTVPYVAPAAHDGKRARFIKTPDGIEWIYFFRAGGQECFRVALEWFV
jgi:hypothetical protein